jgi:enoyl-CoA hydratase/carnithine racemase
MPLPAPQHLRLDARGGVVTLTLDRPERLNALTFDVYRELADVFDQLSSVEEARAIVLTGAGRGFCSGGDVDGIIAQLFARDARALLDFTRATGRLIASIRAVRRPVIAAVNGVAVGAGAVIAAACDLRVAAANARFGFIFPKVGLSGADMGATYLLPRIVGLGHASELLFLGELVDAERALAIGLVNRVLPDGPQALAFAEDWAQRLARGPAFAHTMTKQMIEQEFALPLAQAIEAEAQAQALCMAHPDFRIAHEAFKAKQAPRFVGSEICDEDGAAPGKGKPVA